MGSRTTTTGAGYDGVTRDGLDHVRRRRPHRRRAVDRLRPQPARERGRAHHVRAAPHQGMAGAAQLGALDRIRAERVGRHPQRGHDPGHGIELLREARDEEAVDHVERAELEHDRLAFGQVEDRRDDLLSGRDRIGELERELTRGDVHGHLALLAVLVRAQDRVGVRAQRHDQDRRHRGPHDLEAGVAVDRRTVHLLLPRAHPEFPDGEQHDRLHEHEDRHGGDQQHVVERPDVARLDRALGREPRDDQRKRDADRRGDHTDDDHLDERAVTHGGLESAGPRASLRLAS